MFITAMEPKKHSIRTTGSFLLTCTRRIFFHPDRDWSAKTAKVKDWVIRSMFLFLTPVEIRITFMFLIESSAHSQNTFTLSSFWFLLDLMPTNQIPWDPCI